MSKQEPETKLTIDISDLSKPEIGNILKDLDNIWETDSTTDTMKFMDPIYSLLFNKFHSMKDPKPAYPKPAPSKHRKGTSEKTIELGEKTGYHFLTARRLEWISDISENCQCALWDLWSESYKFCDPKDIPISQEAIDKKLKEFVEMTQEERTKHRGVILDGLYHSDGVDHPCPVCGFQIERDEI